ncbi:MAG: EF-Tu/IF-2/RF-3 family GTPase, partial [Alphaproteobacteria bacterium]|nr:EF-Tu/IF-2/RF-3 family GTPase [Alphaproteobacteria bacterium]
VCRLRDLPILTFCNKMDRESRDTFEIIDEIQENLAIDVTPASWPIGTGADFMGCYDLLRDRLELMDRADRNKVATSLEINGLNDPQLDQHVPAHLLEKLREEVEMARELMPPLDPQALLEGNLTPIWFGSAINSFGVKELMDGIGKFGPEPQVQEANPRQIAPEETKVAGFVFKVQANMDPKHRDRVAFVRMASGHFKRGMKLKHHRTGKQIVMHNPLIFLAQDREVAEEAFAGDIVGIPNYGNLHIGDALTESEDLAFTGIPSFAPEHLQRVRGTDPMKAKHLGRALQQLAEEGAARVFKPVMDADWVVGVMGPLQFDVLADRIRTEYEVPVRFEPASLYTARWLGGAPHQTIKDFADSNRGAMAYDHAGQPVFLARNAWHLDKAQSDAPEISFLKVKEQVHTETAAAA